MAMTVEQFQGRRGRISYRVWEAPDPRRIVVIAHGYGEHIGRYEHVGAALSERGAAVYGPDHMGHGRSEGPRVSIADIDELADDLRTLVGIALEALPDLPVVVLGHSLGGLVATRYAQQHPEHLAGLVLTGPVLGEWAAAAALLAADPIPETPIDPGTLSRDPSVGEAYAADPLVHHGGFRRETLEALVAALERASADAGKVRCPVLHIHGEDDQLVPVDPSRVAVAAFANAEVTTVTYPQARHEVLNETNRSEVLDAIHDFVYRVTA
jgi:alpha-beta hydrolase superfamily lysophospholipase